MSMLNNGAPVPLHEIPRGAYVQLDESTWRRLDRWTVLDKSSQPNAARYQVCWIGSEYPASYVREPSWPTWMGDEPPSTSGVAQ